MSAPDFIAFGEAAADAQQQAAEKPRPRRVGMDPRLILGIAPDWPDARPTCGRNAATSHHDEITADDIRAALDFNHGADSPTLYALRDIILALPGSSPADALAGARVLLAAHTRELADAERQRARERGAEMRARGDRSRVATCAGMHDVIRHLNQHADTLDAAAVTGGAS